MISWGSLFVLLAVSLCPSFGFQVRFPIQSPLRRDATQVCSPFTHSRSSSFRLNGSSAATHSATYVRERLDLHDRFGRWRFLQRLLDEETNNDDVNRIIFIVLDGYLKFPRPTYGSTTETGSPELTVERRQLIEEVLKGCSLGIVPALGDSGEDRLSGLETLLPDPSEDEDGFKGLWDTVIELHGRESVKINETNKTPEWRAVCLVARVILHYDFLIYGLVDEPFK